jgi:hypothetical protein
MGEKGLLDVHFRTGQFRSEQTREPLPSLPAPVSRDELANHDARAGVAQADGEIYGRR